MGYARTAFGRNLRAEPEPGAEPQLNPTSTAGRSPASHPAAKPQRVRRQSRSESGGRAAASPAAEPQRVRRQSRSESGGRAAASPAKLWLFHDESINLFRQSRADSSGRTLRPKLTHEFTQASRSNRGGG